MIAVKVRKGYQLTIPASYRRKLEIAVGDLLHFRLQDGGILIVPRSPEESVGSDGQGSNQNGPEKLGRPKHNGVPVRSDRRPRYQREEFEPLTELISQHLH